MLNATESPSTLPRGFHVFRTPAGIEFEPPRESDALFDALRFAYPEGKTHFERVLDAVQGFIREESQGIATTNHRRVATQPRPLPTKKSDKFPQESRRHEGETPWLVQGVGIKRGKSDGTPGEFKSMTNVWSTDTGRRYRYRPRRPMTEEERTEYRNKRVLGVCAACKRRKRKVWQHLHM
jgi:hypothetical protein